MQFDLELCGLRRMLVRMDSMTVREVSVVARGLIFVVREMLTSSPQVRGRKLEMFGREFVVIVLLLHIVSRVFERRPLRHARS